MGNPMIELSPDDEMKALKEFANKRNFGPRYAQSVARVRLLKMATGIRSLPINVPETYPIKFVTWRDELTAQARIAQVTSDSANLYGKQDDTKPMTAEEMAQVGTEGGVEETDLDAEAVERAREAQAEDTVATDSAATTPERAAPPVEPTGEGPGDQEPMTYREAVAAPQAPEQGTLLDDPDLPPMR